MKKFLSNLFFLIILTSVCAQSKFNINGIYYITNGANTVEVTTPEGNLYSGEVIIPSTISYNDTIFTVNSIGYCSFQMCQQLTMVSLPNSVKKISAQAFWWCSSLKSIILPDSLISIENMAFNCCLELKTVSLPNSITQIGYRAFSGCIGLITINLPNKISNLPDAVFSGCSSLSEIILPDSLNLIGNYAFEDCKNLQKVIVKRNIPPLIYPYTFRNINYDLCDLFVPINTTNLYSSTSLWNSFKKIHGLNTNSSVHYVDTMGNDLYFGTKELPLRNIQTAINLANNGDTILINRGNYYEKVNLFTKNVIIASNYIFSNDTSDIQNTIIDGNNIPGTIFYVGGGQSDITKFIGLTIQNGTADSYTGSAFMFDNKSYGSSVAVIDHCIIQNNNSNNVEQGSTIYSYYSGSDLFNPQRDIYRIQIKNSKFLNNTNGPNGSCIRFFVSDLQIESCLFYNNSGPLSSAILSVRSQPTITNSIFYGEINSVLFIGDVLPIAQPKLISNTFYDDGYSIKGISDIKLYSVNNIFAGKGTPSIFIQDQTYFESNNLYRNNNCLDITAYTYSNSVFGIPQFKNTVVGDFSLNSNSPAINKGSMSIALNSIVLKAPENDYYGNLRPNQVGTYPNIGAIQFDNSKITCLSKFNLDERIIISNKIIEISNTLGKSIMIFDISGRKVFETLKSKESEKIKVNNVGVYFIIIDNFKKKVIVY